MSTTLIISRPAPESAEADNMLRLRYQKQNSSVGPEMPETDMFNSADGGYFYAGGIKRAFAARRSRKNQKLNIKKIKAQGKAQSRVLKGKAKVGKQTAAQIGAKAQQAAAKALGKTAPASKPPVMPRPAPPPPAKKGLSTGAMIGIGVGALALIVGTVVLIVKMKKGKK